VLLVPIMLKRKKPSYCRQLFTAEWAQTTEPNTDFYHRQRLTQ